MRCAVRTMPYHPGMGRTTTIATYVPTSTTVVGTDTAVAAILRAADREHRLLTDPGTIAATFVRLPDGRVSVRVDMLLPRPAPPRAMPTLGIARALALSLSFVAALFVVGTAVIFALRPLLMGVGRFAESGGALAAVIVLLFAGWLVLSVKRRHACKGLHCDGCSRRH